MATDDPKADKQTMNQRRRGSAERLFVLLASVPFAALVVAAIAIACIVGTLLPQGEEVVQYLKKNPDAVQRMELLGFLGLTHVYSSAWFIALLGLLAMSLAACTFRRLRAAADRTGRARGRAVGSVITHISLLLVLAGGVIRGIWGERGEMPLREGETKSSFIVQGQPVELPFSIRLLNFELETYGPQDEWNLRPRIVGEQLVVRSRLAGTEWKLPVEPGIAHELTTAEQPARQVVIVKVLRKVADFVIDMETREVKSRSELPRNPAVLVEMSHHSRTNRQWLFSRHPDFDMHDTGEAARVLDMRYVVEVTSPKTTIKDYKSTLQVLEGKNVMAEKTIEVNLPLSYAGYTFYQSGFNPQDLKWTSLQVVKDPGVPIVYAGFVLMIVGLAAVFYLYPQDRPGAPRPESVSKPGNIHDAAF